MMSLLGFMLEEVTAWDSVYIVCIMLVTIVIFKLRGRDEQKRYRKNRKNRKEKAGSKRQKTR